MLLDCNHEPSEHSNFTTGYGVDKDNKKYCYDCCAERERQSMIATGRGTLYTSLDKTTNKWIVNDWPGKLKFSVGFVKSSYHNMAGTQTHFWFTGPDGYIWHGIQWGTVYQRSQPKLYYNRISLSDGYYCRVYRTNSKPS